MKRTLGYVAVTLIMVLLLAGVAQPQVVGNAITRAMLQTRDWVIGGVWSGAGSLHLDGGIGATPGNKVNLEGAAGDTYLVRDADTGCWQEWKDGVLSWQMCSGYAVPPTCLTDTSTVAVGGLCVDPTNGKLKYRGTLEQIP